MGTQTELIGQEIFVTNKEGKKSVPPSGGMPPVDENDFMQGGWKPKKDFKNVILLNVLIGLFLASCASGLYIIFSGGTGGGKENAAESSSTVRLAAATQKSKDGVALIKVRGVITEPQGVSAWGDPAGASAVAKRIRATADKSNVKAVILDINSPGGTVAAVQDIYNAILYARSKNKPVIALFRDVAASGGYYIAVACDKIVAQPGTLTGSIGVIFQTSNFEGLMDKVGVKFEALKSGAHKDMGSSFRPMTQEERGLFNELIQDSYSQFFNAVQTGRPNIPLNSLKTYADGRVFTGRQALNLGFIDILGGEEEALQAAGELAGIKNPEVINIKASPLREWLSSFDAEASSKNLSRQLESVTAPKMAYLWTGL